MESGCALRSSRQIKFAGDVVLDVVEVCHPVAFKHGKAVLEIVLPRPPLKMIARISPIEKFCRPCKLSHRSNVDRSCREVCQQHLARRACLLSLLVSDQDLARLLANEDFPAFGAPTKTTTNSCNIFQGALRMCPDNSVIEICNCDHSRKDLKVAAWVP